MNGRPGNAGGARFFLGYNGAMDGIGFGLGLRHEHYEEIVASPGKVAWFEALSENYMIGGGQPLHWLDTFRRDYPMALHGVSLSGEHPDSFHAGVREPVRERRPDLAESDEREDWIVERHRVRLTVPRSTSRILSTCRPCGQVAARS